MKERLAIGGALLATGISGLVVNPEGAHADAPNHDKPKVEALGSTVFVTNLSEGALKKIIDNRQPSEGTVFRIASNPEVRCPKGKPAPPHPKKIVTISSPNGDVWRYIDVEDKRKLRDTIASTTKEVTTLTQGIGDTIAEITIGADRGEGNNATCGNYEPEKIIIPDSSIKAYVAVGKSANGGQETKGSDTTDNSPRADKAEGSETDMTEVLKWVIVGGVAFAAIAAYKVFASRRQGR